VARHEQAFATAQTAVAAVPIVRTADLYAMAALRTVPLPIWAILTHYGQRQSKQQLLPWSHSY
jgi:hypothetical protein